MLNASSIESAAVLVSSLDSPFNAACETLMLPSKINPSAGILSPACTRTVSPFTISLVKILTIFPFLTTFAYVLLYSSCKASLLELFLYSDNVLNPVARAMARTMLIISTTSFSPASAGTIIPNTASITFNARAAQSTLIHISSNAPINIDHKDSCSFFVSSLVPYFCLLSLTLSSLRPRISCSLLKFSIRYKYPP